MHQISGLINHSLKKFRRRYLEQTREELPQSFKTWWVSRFKPEAEAEPETLRFSKLCSLGQNVQHLRLHLHVSDSK